MTTNSLSDVTSKLPIGLDGVCDQIRSKPMLSVGIAAVLGHFLRPALLGALIAAIANVTRVLAAPALLVWLVVRYAPCGTGASTSTSEPVVPTTPPKTTALPI